MEQNFFRLTPQQALQELHAASGGLTSAEAAQRLAKVGPTSWPRARKRVPWRFLSGSSRIFWWSS